LPCFYLPFSPPGARAPLAPVNPADPSAPQFAEKIEMSGVSYVGKINDFLYRGSQPNERGIEQLKKLELRPPPPQK
jgi:hypothetical protein